MKTPLLPIVLAAACATSAFAQSRRTAEFILSDPAKYEGTEVALDVAMVQPLRWKSPLPEFMFFHALTLDRQARQPGGAILVAVPSESSAAFAKKYGTNREGRMSSTTLRGRLVAAANPRAKRPRVFLVDTTGNLLSAIEKAKTGLPVEAFEPEGPGIPGGPAPKGPRAGAM